MNSRTRKNAALTLTAAEQATGGQVLRGWCLSGPGSARYGWYSRSAAGAQTYLGRTLEEVRATLCLTVTDLYVQAGLAD